jgi:homocysteine S-methyltransferase
MADAPAGPPFWVLDGALGTLVEARGFDVNNPLWGSACLVLDEGPEAVDQIHREYVEAGADLIIANTHNASLQRCADYGARGFPLGRRARAFVNRSAAPDRALLELVNRTAVEAARNAARPTTRVAACLMSPDRAYAERATLDAGQIRDGLVHQARLLDGLDLDLVIFEMISTDADVEGVARTLPELKSPRAVGVTCGADGRTHGGVDPVAAARRLVDAGARAVFVQCTHHDHVQRPLRRLIAALEPNDVTVGAYANDGRVWRDGAWRGEGIGPQAYAALAARWVDAGARIVGSCCGTDPAHTRALARLRDAGG